MQLLTRTADRTTAMSSNAQSIWRINQVIFGPLLKEGVEDQPNPCATTSPVRRFLTG
jgi:hypothetical protein